jgi:uncharacterized protein YbjT (DUF2867 family)
MSFLKKTGKALADVIPGLGNFTFDEDLGTVFITSGTGVIGHRVALSLLQAGHKSVRVGIWKSDREIGGDKSMGQKVAEELAARGANVVDFDWSDEDDFAAAVAGVRTVFCSMPHMDLWDDVFPTFVDTCKKAKVEHFVKISFFQAGDIENPYRQTVPFVEFHGTCDDILANAQNDSSFSYTILAPSHIMATPLIQEGPTIRNDKKYVTASYGMGVNYVSPNDVADAAIVCLLITKKHRNMTYNLSGPGPVRDVHIARLFSEFYGFPVEHVALGYHEYVEYVKTLNHPEWLIMDSAAFEKMKASGIDELASSYTKDLETIIGKPPETFADYLMSKESMSPAWCWPSNADKFATVPLGKTTIQQRMFV